MQQLPDVLRDPPWLARQRRVKPTFHLSVEMSDRPERVELGPPARRRRDAEELLARWNGDPEEECPNADVVDVLAHFGVRAIDGLVARLPWIVTDPVVLAVDSPRVATAFLKAAEGDLARAWFDAHVATALVAALPLAVGGGDASRRAIDLTVRLARSHDALAREIAAAYGPDVEAALAAWLAWDPRCDLPEVIPTLPPIWNATRFSRPLLKDGTPLPLEAVDHIGTMLAMSPPRAPRYRGLEDVVAACDAGSLAELGLSATQAWDKAKTREHTWMRDALVQFGDDETLRRAARTLSHPTTMAVLTQMSEPAALLELLKIAARRPTSTYTVGLRLQTFANANRTTVDELVESLSRPAATFDYAGKTLRLGVDARLEPCLVEGGRELRSLPAARKVTAEIERARAIWRDWKEDVPVLASHRLAALERAMVTRRTWTSEVFALRFLRDPIMRRVVTTLLWTQANKRFRVLDEDDATFVDERDEPIAPDDTKPIGLAHPVVLEAAELTAWRTVFADYRIVQPIVQLDRPAHPLPRHGNVYRVTFGARPKDALLARLTDFREDARRPGCLILRRDRTRICLDDAASIDHAEVTWTNERGKPTPLREVDPVLASEDLALFFG